MVASENKVHKITQFIEKKIANTQQKYFVLKILFNGCF